MTERDTDAALARARIRQALFGGTESPEVRIGRFTVLDVLGRGGMGTVYRAHDPDLDRRVAIKLLRQGHDPEETREAGVELFHELLQIPRPAGTPTPKTEVARARIVREAKAMARLSHPNVVQIYEVGDHEGRVFIAMEHIEGMTLNTWLHEKPRPWPEVLDVLVHAGRGLAAAHRAGLVHRDFKPDNVLIGEDGRVCVADFGLVRDTGAIVAQTSKPPARLARGRVDAHGDTLFDPRRPLTRAGALMGTPAYMSPEQLGGRPHSAHTDQYSFCVTLYEALFRRPPAPADTLEELVTRVLHGDLDEPPAEGTVPRWVRQAVMRGLKVDPAERWPSMEALLAELGHDPHHAQVDCGRCGSTNHRGRRYCGRCGAALKLMCRACGEINAPDVGFCGGCGATLARAPGPADPASGRAPAGLSAERRQVAVLHVRLCSPEATDPAGLDPELEHRLVRRLAAITETTAQRLGGVLQLHGSSVLAVFGAPFSHGDDPARGARAALVIRGEAQRVRAAEPLPLRVAIGLASGEVIVSTREGLAGRDLTVTGAPLAKARALAEHAGAGEILVDDGTRPLLEESFGPRPASASGQAWRLGAPTQARPASPVVTQGPLVGRREPLARFRAMLDACVEHRSGGVAYVRGEAGIGKTRLIAAFEASAWGQGLSVHRGLVLDFGVGRGEEAMTAIAGGLLELPLDAPEGRREAAVARALEQGFIGREHQPFLHDLLALPQPRALADVFEAMDADTRARGRQEVLTRLVEGASTLRPRLLVIEDVHWASTQTLADLRALATAVLRSPSLLVMSTRPAEDPLGDDQDPSWQVMELAPLRREDAELLARSFGPAAPEIVQRCLDRAEGHPMFLEQLLRAAEHGDAELPGTIHNLVLARLDRLSVPGRLALKGAAVLGQRFSLEALRFVLDDPATSLDEARALRLIRPEGSMFLFDHALIRDGVHASLVQEQRGHLHRRAASWYRERDPGLWAEHLARARDPEAKAACQQAARTLQDDLNHERALALIELGLALPADDSGDEHHALMCLRGRIEHDRGDLASSVATFREALELARDDRQRARAGLGLAQGLRSTGRVHEALRAVDEAERRLKASAEIDSTERICGLARAHELRGHLHFPLGRFEICQVEHEHALALAHELGDPEAEARALGGLGDTGYASGRWRTANGYLRRCIELCRRHRLLRTEVAYTPMMLQTELCVRPVPEILDGMIAAERHAARVGHDRARGLTLSTLSAVSLHGAQWERAREWSTAAVERLEAMGARRVSIYARANRAVAEAHLGLRAQALEAMRALVRGFDEADRSFAGPMVHGVLARMTDDPEERRGSLETGERLLGGFTVSHNHLSFRRDAIETALDLDDPEAALHHAEALATWTEQGELPLADFLVVRARALARWSAGERSQELRDELRALSRDAERLGLLRANGRLARALADA